MPPAVCFSGHRRVETSCAAHPPHAALPHRHPGASRSSPAPAFPAKAPRHPSFLVSQIVSEFTVRLVVDFKKR